MLAFNPPNYLIRPAVESEAGLTAYLRMASLLCLEMRGQSLATIRTFMSVLPDVDAQLLASGSYWVADKDGDFIAGGGWSLPPLPFRGSGLADAGGKLVNLSMAEGSVLIRGFFLDPDMGRGAGAALLSQVEADAARAGYSAGEIVVPASSRLYYHRLGFKPVTTIDLKLGAWDTLPLLHLRKPFPHCLARAA